jgi:hypothetical protein
MLKYLRIAVTALSLTACLLLIVLWVRSYYYLDILENATSSRLLQLQSITGRFVVDRIEPGRNPRLAPIEVADILSSASRGRTYSSERIDDSSSSWVNFGYYDAGITTRVIVPYWIPVVLLAALAAAPWIRWSRRFSLRALLIATALVAVVCGLIVAF